jgi:hypothetical protein
MSGAPNHLDFLLALDGYTREDAAGRIVAGWDLHTIAYQAGLVSQGDQRAAHWAGELVGLGYLLHGPGNPGDRRPIPPGFTWGDDDANRFSDYRITSAGRQEADRIRRLQRERRTDAALGHDLPRLGRRWMSEAQLHAVVDALRRLQAALDGADHTGAIGAAKDLVEAACKVALGRAGTPLPRNPDLPRLFKLALLDDATRGSDVGKSLAATVQRLAELRNAAGAGHGHAALPDASASQSRLAASAAVAVADFILGDDVGT